MLIQKQIIPYPSQTIKFLFLPYRIRQIIFSILTGTNHISQLVMEEERQLRTQANALKYLYHIPFALFLKSDFVTISRSINVILLVITHMIVIFYSPLVLYH